MARLNEHKMRKTTADLRLVKLPVVADVRGNLAFVQQDTLPHTFERVYYLFDIPSSASRGGHSHIAQHETLVALSGSFEVIVNDGENTRHILLNKPDIGLHIPPGFWRELNNFSSGAVCLVFAEKAFDESDYIRDFDDYLKHSGR